MPPPYRVWMYRGYELVQWCVESKMVEISWGSHFVDYAELDAAERLVDEWLDAR